MYCGLYLWFVPTHTLWHRCCVRPVTNRSSTRARATACAVTVHSERCPVLHLPIFSLQIYYNPASTPTLQLATHFLFCTAMEKASHLCITSSCFTPVQRSSTIVGLQWRRSLEEFVCLPGQRATWLDPSRACSMRVTALDWMEGAFFQNLVPMKAFSCDVFVQRVPLCPNAPTVRTLELCCQLLAPQSMVLSPLLRGLQAQFLCYSYWEALILFPLHTSAVSPNESLHEKTALRVKKFFS